MNTPLIAEVLGSTLSITDRSKDTTCLECSEFGVRPAGGISDFDMYCMVDRWMFLTTDDLSDVRKQLKAASKCSDFVRIDG